MNKQTSNFFDKKKNVFPPPKLHKNFYPAGKIFLPVLVTSPLEFEQHCPATGNQLWKKKKKTNMNEAQDHVFHQILRPTKSKVQFPIKRFFFSKDLQLL